MLGHERIASRISAAAVAQLRIATDSLTDDSQ